MRLCVVPCGSMKIWRKDPDAGPTEAKHAYVGPFAKACIDYAEKFCPGDYVILSAKHGFLFPNEIVPGDYNVSFNDPRTNPISVGELRKQAGSKGLTRYDEIMVIAGRRYVNIVKEVFRGKKIIVPLEGIGGLGKMISLLKKAVKEGREITELRERP